MPVEIKGAEQIVAKLLELGAEANTAIVQTIAQSGEAAAAYARMKSPMGATGGNGAHLGQSIHCDVNGGADRVTATVKAQSAHAQYVEFGTGWPIGHQRYTTLKDGTKKPGWVAPINGSFRWIKGMAPRPFMRPAKEFAQKNTAFRLSNALKRLVK